MTDPNAGVIPVSVAMESIQDITRSFTDAINENVLDAELADKIKADAATNIMTCILKTLLGTTADNPFGNPFGQDKE